MAVCIHCGQQVPESAQLCPHCGKAVSAAAAPGAPIKRSRSPLVLILVGLGCLGLLFVFGIIAAIAIPNFLSARDKANRFQSLAAMRVVGEALNAYHQQNGRYPSAGSPVELATALQTHATTLPTRDAWDQELRYLCWPASAAGCQHYTLASAGKDGRFEQEDLSSYRAQQTPLGDYNRDIVMLDGNFLQSPGSD